ncbi:MAG: RT0821/Lpp0805 family surface protein [Rhizobiaceae bacterium]
MQARLASSGLVFAMAIAAPALLAGCGSAGFSLAGAGVDRASVTGSVASADVESGSDEEVIRDAVARADPGGVAARPLAWANEETGARGAIEALREVARAGKTCRVFRASRENYEGVGLFEGETCRTAAGVWQMIRFLAV